MSEHHQIMHRCMAKDWHAWHRHGASAARAKSSSSRSDSTIAAHASCRRKESCRPRHAQLLSGSIFSHRTFDADRDSPSCGPRCTSRMRAMRCRGTARAFEASLLVFSEKQRSSRGLVYSDQYLAVQRVGSESLDRIYMCYADGAVTSCCLGSPG